jgi:SAM-dependent methyltransferase
VGTHSVVEQPDGQAAPNFVELTDMARHLWASGDFAKVGVAHVIVGELLCRAVDVHPGEHVLDVAAGSGNTALAAARRGAAVTASDFVESLLDTAEARAETEGLAIETRLADAQALPFEDASFDVVVSTFGAMFAPDQQRAADEMLRVCRPGGRIGLASWTPASLVCSQHVTLARYVPPPVEGLRSPVEWGTVPRLRELFSDGISELRARPRLADLCAPSAEALVAFNRAWLGPFQAAFAQLDEPGRERLAADLATNAERFNRATDGTFVAGSEYLEAVVVRA